MKLQTLKTIRKEKKMHLKELSNLSGVNEQRLSLIERGLVNPSFNTVVSICEALECKMILLRNDQL